MASRRLVAAVVSLVLLVTGCAGSKVDPAAEVTLRGTLSLADGSPAADVWVGLLRVPDLGEVLFQGLVVAGTFGVACLSEQPPPICQTVRSTRTNVDGEYVFRLRGSDVRGTLGQAVNFQLSAVAPARSGLVGASIDIGFVIQRTDLTLPATRFWEPDRLSAVTDQGSVTVDWSAIDDAVHTSRPYQVHFTVDEPAAAPVWHQAAVPGDRIDARALSDVRGTFHVTGYGTADGPDTTFQTTYGSHRISVQGTAGAPASRWHPCWVQGPTTPVQLDPCTLTDGSYAQSFPAQSCDVPEGPASPPPCSSNTLLYIDLGRRLPIGAVFAHNLHLTGDAIIEISDDTQHWTERGRVAGGFSTVDLNGAPGRYVRLRPVEAGARITELYELSVWAA